MYVRTLKSSLYVLKVDNLYNYDESDETLAAVKRCFKYLLKIVAFMAASVFDLPFFSGWFYLKKKEKELVTGLLKSFV